MEVQRRLIVVEHSKVDRLRVVKLARTMANSRQGKYRRILITLLVPNSFKIIL